MGDDDNYERPGTQTIFDDLRASGPNALAPVGSRDRNVTPEGIFDLVGDGAAEWTLDWYAESYRAEAQIDPAGPTSPQPIVTRGRNTGTFWGHVLRGRETHSTDRVELSESFEQTVGFSGFRLLLDAR
ncbi:MAG: hypothetical protein SGJ11_06275 [Phycisphaerae bacterium]|nr:hypothetical protein [Phycisphaerae bacterium]